VFVVGLPMLRISKETQSTPFSRIREKTSHHVWAEGKRLVYTRRGWSRIKLRTLRFSSQRSDLGTRFLIVQRMRRRKGGTGPVLSAHK